MKFANCFYYFKDRTRIREQRSTPILKIRSKSKSNSSAADSAINGFNRLLMIGEGGFGSMFKGSIKAADGKGDPIVVAIKMLDRNGFQVYFDFQNNPK
ncbi:Serine/threonine-protein kinase PCRK1 [Camellia lanceoleosa]|uniref:Serine/threonine-protein kinase PCRK1 n=1 Tax=Camellia lanceoleosa TaxID=1840588 RepID=A0ACC0GZ55_9ERIC|nr:Serine/threonine-protein kinase PCRK1 [Camellia lanceoleosa]